MGKSARMDAQLTIFFRSVIAQGIEHSARLLRGGGIVKVNQRLAVDLLVEDGKVGPDGCPVNHLLPICNSAGHRAQRAASAWWRHCQSKSKAGRGPSGRGWESRPGWMPS